MTIELEPIEPPVLFVPERAVAIELLAHSSQLPIASPVITQGAESELRYARLDDRRGPKYRVFMQSSVETLAPTLSANDRQRYLQLPTSFTVKLFELARTWATTETEPIGIANRILERLQTDYRYDINSPSSNQSNPLEHFLLVSKRGHCEFYSTAMALLLRSLNVPTRNVTGFAGANYNRYGRFYSVRQADAHSWVEAWIDGYGWKRFDPTPLAPLTASNLYERSVTTLRDIVEAAAQRWSRHVERYDLRQQTQLATGVGNGIKHAIKRAIPRRVFWQVLVAIGIACVLVVSILARRWRRTRWNREDTSETGATSQEIVHLYQLLDQLLIRRGVARPVSTPPWTHARALADLGHPFAEEILALTKRYLDVRFGGAVFTPNDVRAYAQRVNALRRIPANEWHLAQTQPSTKY
jgi:transglutaminase-like putative cysteine protease